MEPAAPGTEDEVKPIHQYNKQENEKERLLSIKAQLPGKKFGNVFEFSYQNGCETWYCNLCECPVMGKVYHHEIGKRHTNNMQAAGILPHSTTESEPLPQFPHSSVLVAPGEPVPPGFESEAIKDIAIQERLDNYKVGPLIGLEYLLEIHEYDRDKEPSYLCILCEKRGDPRTVIAHLASYNHMIQYLQRHFVTCYRTLSPYITKQYKPNWQAAMQKIAEAIEVKYGRLKPHYVEREALEQRRIEYQHMIAMGPHFSDKNGCTFEELLDKNELTKPVVEEPVKVIKPSEDVSKRPYRKTGTVPGTNEKKSPSPPVVNRPKKPNKTNSNNVKTKERRASLSSISSISSSDLSEFEPFPRKGERAKSPAKRNRHKSHSSNDRHKRKRSLSPKKDRFGRDREKEEFQRKPLQQKSNYGRPRSDFVVDNRDKNHQEKLDQYKKLAAAIENDMEKIRKQHEKNPEKHPQYNEEWKKFWNKRYKELQAEGKDAVNYDFKPEWIQFWNKRMTELHNAEVKSKKDALRKRLGLPDEPAPICFRITGKKKPGQSESSKPVPIASVPDHDPDVIVIDDKDDETISSKRSRSSWEADAPYKSTRLPRARSRDKNGKSRGRNSKDREYHSRERSTDRDRSRERERDRSYERGRDYREIIWERYSPSRDKRYRERSFECDPYYRDAYSKPYLPDYIKPPRVMRDVTRHPVLSPLREPEPIIEPEVEDGEVNIVSVLRLLTALEEKLGSLGPKVIDLLAKALALEKNEANSSETLLDNEVNSVLFETVKEKLKGQLLAELVDYNQEKAFKNAIKKTAELIHMSEERRKHKKQEKKREPVTVPGVGTVDKAAIAKQIATALVMQGKTDVSQQELEQLINAVVGMAEASKNSNKPINTASFLQQLTEQKFKTKENTSSTAFSEAVTQVKNVVSLSSESHGNSMEGLSDSDLQTLLQNFKDLLTDEQQGLIAYLKKLEAKEPERVERLRKFVKLESGSTEGGENLENEEKSKDKSEGRATSPFSSRMGGGNPMLEENDEEEREEDEDKEENKKEENKNETTKINLDSEDEEYSYEDVFKAATKNVTEKEKEIKKRTELKAEQNLTDAKALIANLMGQLGAKNSAPREVSVSGSNIPISTSLTQTLSSLPISMANLASIVNNANKNTISTTSTTSLTENLPILGKAISSMENPVNALTDLPDPNRNLGSSGGYNLPNDSVYRSRCDMDGNPINIPSVGQGLAHSAFTSQNLIRGTANMVYSGPGMGSYPNPNAAHSVSVGSRTDPNTPVGLRMDFAPAGGYDGSNMGPSSQGMGPSRPPVDHGPVQYPIKQNVYGGNQYQRSGVGNVYGNQPPPQYGNAPPRGYPEYDQNRMGNPGGYPMPNRNQYGRPANYGGRW